MKVSLRSWPLLVVASAVLVAASLSVVTWIAFELERDHLDARAEAEHQTQLRLGLWRLDSYLAPLLTQEAARPWFHYRPFVPSERAFTRMLNAIDPGEVIAPSPLLGFRSELIELHFEVNSAGTWTSPQAPTGNLLDLAQANLSDPEYVPPPGPQEYPAVVAYDEATAELGPEPRARATRLLCICLAVGASRRRSWVGPMNGASDC